MGIKEINKLGEAINEIKKKSDSEIDLLKQGIPENIDIINSKKLGAELIYFKTYEHNTDILHKIIFWKCKAWGEMIKLIEEFAIKGQGKKIVKKKGKIKKSGSHKKRRKNKMEDDEQEIEIESEDVDFLGTAEDLDFYL